jgi:formylglycine-generating enzyme required for sulfatase activity
VKRPLGAVAIALLGACGDTGSPPLGQLVVYVDTDAPVVSADGVAPPPDQPQGLFDHVRFDVTSPDPAAQCSTCANDFAVDADAFQRSAVSIGILLPPKQGGWSLRVRLYRFAFAGADGEPDVGSTLDATFALPPVADTGVVEWTAQLTTDSVGEPLGIDGAPALSPGRPPGSSVGTWPGAVRAACTGDAPAGMVCVPGGAFWMGDGLGDRPAGTITGWHRLVVLSPFFLDASEMTVARARVLNASALGVVPWSGGDAGSSGDDWCTFTPSPGSRDTLPLSCVAQTVARAICRRLGGDLPTEAQLEYAMGGLRGQPFVWGADSPECTDAVWGRNGVGVSNQFSPQTCLTYATALPKLGAPEAPGWGRRDRLELPTGTLLDLTGNLGEWTRDVYAEPSEACWSGAGAMNDPVCATQGAQGEVYTTRGGSWHDGGTLLEAAARRPVDPTQSLPDVGFRCAQPGS